MFLLANKCFSFTTAKLCQQLYGKIHENNTTGLAKIPGIPGTDAGRKSITRNTWNDTQMTPASVLGYFNFTLIPSTSSVKNTQITLKN